MLSQENSSKLTWKLDSLRFLFLNFYCSPFIDSSLINLLHLEICIDTVSVFLVVITVLSVVFTALKVPKYRFYFLVHIFLYSEWIQENTDQKKLRIWTIFWQCLDRKGGSRGWDSFFWPFQKSLGRHFLSLTLSTKNHRKLHRKQLHLGEPFLLWQVPTFH